MNNKEFCLLIVNIVGSGGESVHLKKKTRVYTSYALLHRNTTVPT